MIAQGLAILDAPGIGFGVGVVRFQTAIEGIEFAGVADSTADD
jgi:hypothetical protein